MPSSCRLSLPSIGRRVPGSGQTATNIVAQNIQGKMGSAERETSVKQMIGRVVDTISGQPRGRLLRDRRGGRHLEDELRAVLVNQYAWFNSPVWFNVGFEESSAQPASSSRSTTTMESILDWIRGEDHLPRWLGVGRQPPRLRSSKEQLQGRLRLRAGVVHARRRRVRRHDQVGRQDTARGEDGRPRHRPP